MHWLAFTKEQGGSFIIGPLFKGVIFETYKEKRTLTIWHIQIWAELELALRSHADSTWSKSMFPQRLQSQALRRDTCSKVSVSCWVLCLIDPGYQAANQTQAATVSQEALPLLFFLLLNFKCQCLDIKNVLQKASFIFFLFFHNSFVRKSLCVVWKLINTLIKLSLKFW